MGCYENAGALLIFQHLRQEREIFNDALFLTMYKNKETNEILLKAQPYVMDPSK
jgi:hypothetical protein